MTKKTTEMDSDNNFLCCRMPEMPVRVFPPDVDPTRLSAIMPNLKKWLNGTVLRYYFFDKQTDRENVDGKWLTWTAPEAQKNVVRSAFKVWKNLGISLEFKEVSNREDADVRIGFMQDNSSWSYVGTDVLNIKNKQQRTMNFGWDLTQNIDTAIHEIGHTLGLEHEHQNPEAGIAWNEEAVYTFFGGSPNYWTRQSTYWNIIRKLDSNQTRGSDWDPNSVMHYAFKSGLINAPTRYRNGLRPNGGLSDSDKEWVRRWYPALNKPDDGGEITPPPTTILEPAKSLLLKLKSGEQQDFQLQPPSNQDYELRTFGKCDTLFVLYEDNNGELRRLGGDDDSGENRNAYMKLRLFHDRKYILRVRVNYVDGPAVIMWW